MFTQRIRLWTMAAAIVLSAAAPSLADIDAASLTCGQFNAADGAGKDAYGNAVLRWVNNTGNAREAETLPILFSDHSKKDVRQWIAHRCAGQPAEANVIVRLLSPS